VLNECSLGADHTFSALWAFLIRPKTCEQSRLGPWACRDNTHVALVARNLAARGLHWLRLLMQKKRLVAVTRLW
jgi:hypothetical protein